MKNTKRLLIVLSLVMAFSALLAVSSAAAVIDSGTCESTYTSVDWTLTDDYTLTITQTEGWTKWNEVPNHRCEGYADGYSSYSDQIKKVVIGNGIKKFSTSCFKDFTALETVEHTSVTQLDNQAFNGCTSLMTIYRTGNEPEVGTLDLSTISNNGSWACVANAPATAIKLGEVKTIPAQYIFNCKNLTSIELAAATESIAENAFEGCDALTTIYGMVGSAANTFAAQNGYEFIDNSGTPVSGKVNVTDSTNDLTWSYDATTNTLVISGTSENLTMYPLPSWDASENIPWYPLCNSIYTVVIEAPIKSIDAQFAFSNLRRCERIVIPNNQITINGACTFAYANSLKAFGVAGTPEGTIDLRNIVKGSTAQTFEQCFNGSSVRILMPDAVPTSSVKFCDDTANVTFVVKAGTASETLAKEVQSKSAEKWIPDNVTVEYYNIPENGSKVNVTDETNDLVWVFDEETKTLTIYGSSTELTMDPVPSWTEAAKVNIPWYSIINDIEKVVVEAPITKIATDYAFGYLPNCKTIVLPDNSIELNDNNYIVFNLFTNATSLTTLGPEGTPEGTIDLRGFYGTFGQMFEGAFDNVKVIVLMPEKGSNSQFVSKFGKDSATVHFVVAKDSEYEAIIKELIAKSGEKNYADTMTMSYYGEKLPGESETPDIPYAPASDFTYAVNADGGITVSKYNGTDTHVAIPEEIDGKPVTVIGANAFKDNANLQIIRLPQSLESIGESAFEGCKYISGIVIPENVTSIGARAFANCLQFKYIQVSTKLAAVGESAFEGCHADLAGNEWVYGVLYTGTEEEFAAIDIAEGNELFADSVKIFEYVPDPTGYYLYRYGWDENSATIQLYLGFEEDVVIPDTVSGLKVIYAECTTFLYNDRIKSMKLAAGMTLFNSNAIRLCPNFTEFIDNPDNTTFAVVDGVLYSEDLKTLYNVPMGITVPLFVVPDHVEVIDGAFASNTGARINTLIIPDSVKTIGEYSFDYSFITNIIFPTSVESIATSAFSGATCTNLMFMGTAEEWSALTSAWVGNRIIDYNCIIDDSTGFVYTENGDGTVKVVGTSAPASTLTIPSEIDGKSVKSIGYAAFANTYRFLTKLVIEEGIEQIEGAAFASCQGLLSITIPESITKIDSYAFVYLDHAPHHTVYYGGSENSWNNIAIDTADGANDGLINSDIVFAKTDDMFLDVTIEPEVIYSGDNVIVKISVKDNPGFAGADFALEFDKNYLTPVAVTTSADAALTSNLQDPNQDKNELDKVTALLYKESNITGDIEILTFVFKAKDVSESTDTAVRFVVGDGKITNQDGVLLNAPNVYANVTVSKYIPVTGMFLNKTQFSLTVGNSATLFASVLPTDAINKNVTWISSDSDIVSVEDGVVTALKAGVANVTAITEEGGFRASCKITVENNVMSGDINGDEKVDIQDLVRLAQFLASWQVTTVKEASDCNGDAQVNIQDLVRLAQFLANWDVELESGFTGEDSDAPDYGGAEFKILNSDTIYGMYTFTDPDRTGDSLDDVIYMRNLEAEKNFNASITEETQPFNSVAEYAKNLLLAEEDVYDIMYLPVSQLTPLVSENLFYDLHSVEGLDLEGKGWHQSFINDNTINGKLYYTTNDINLMYMEGERDIIVTTKKNIVFSRVVAANSVSL